MLDKREHLYLKSDDYLAQMLCEIEKAQHSIDIEYYMISSDSIGMALFDSLAQARARGVIVRMLIDGWGSHESLPVLIDWAHKHNLELQVYHPPLWLHEAIPSLGHLFKINQRTHRKLVVIDKNVAYTGSINLSQEHFGAHAWLDLGLRLEGPVVSEIQAVFKASWQQESDEGVCTHTLAKLPSIHSPIRANQTKRRRYKLYLNLIKRIDNAQQRVTIINPYFVPTARIVRALKRAALRGVEVNIVLPFKSDLRLFPWFNIFGVRSLIRFGVRFYEYMPTILHSKLTLIDDFYMMGSSNWNTRSFYHDRELDIEIQSEVVKAELDAFLTETIGRSRRIDHRTLRSRYHNDFALRPIFYFLKYWI